MAPSPSEIRTFQFRESNGRLLSFVLHCAGGTKILLAAGKGLEAFFNVYAVHKADHVMEIMETLRIGNVHIDDMKEVLVPERYVPSKRTLAVSYPLIWMTDGKDEK